MSMIPSSSGCSTKRGHSEADLERIFDKFFRVRRSDRSVPARVRPCNLRGFVEAMGGSIAAANRTDRTGAVFTIRLPVPVTSKLQAEAIS